MERKGPTPAGQSSKASRLSSLHIVISSLAALGGLGIAAYQAFGPSAPQQPPVNVTVTVDPTKVAEAAATGQPTAAEKSDAETGMAATYTAALKDGSEQRYDFAALFDGNPETYVTIAAPDTEINVLVTFGSSAEQVAQIDYAPPPGADPAALATVADIMVLPDGDIGAAGRPVSSFKLPVEGGRQSFALPAGESGKGLWLRVAGGAVVGDFSIRKP